MEASARQRSYTGRALRAHQKADDNEYKGLGILYEKQSELKDAKEMFERAIEMQQRIWSNKE